VGVGRLCSLVTITTVLGLAGMELTFFTAAHMVLCFGFVAKTVDNTPMLWLLLNSACTVSRLSLFPHSDPPSEWAGGVQEIIRGHSWDR